MLSFFLWNQGRDLNWSEYFNDEILTLKQIHLAHSAVNESANPRNSMRQSSPLFALAESSGKSSSSLSKLASSNSKSRLKSKWKKWEIFNRINRIIVFIYLLFKPTCPPKNPSKKIFTTELDSRNHTNIFKNLFFCSFIQVLVKKSPSSSVCYKFLFNFHTF